MVDPVLFNLRVTGLEGIVHIIEPEVHIKGLFPMACHKVNRAVHIDTGVLVLWSLGNTSMSQFCALFREPVIRLQNAVTQPFKGYQRFICKLKAWP